MQLLAEQVIAQNTKTQVVVLSSDPKGSEYVEWQPAGDPSGGDIQIIPESVARSAAFTKLVSRGIVTLVSAGDDYLAAMDKQRAAFEARNSGAAAKAQEAIVPEEHKDLLSIPCIGPNDRGTGVCGNPVPVREKTKDETPALCPTHQHLAAQYIAHQEQEGTKIVTKWTRATVTAREHQTV